MSKEKKLYPKFGWGDVGFVDSEGRCVIEPRFEGVGDFHEGIAQVYEDNSVGFIDEEGRWIIKPWFFEAGDFSEGIARVVVDEFDSKVGFINKEKEWVVEPTTHIWDAGDFHEGLVWARNDSMKYGYIGADGQWAIEPRFDEATNFSGGVAQVRLDGRSFFIDREGNEVASPGEEWGVVVGAVEVERPDFTGGINIKRSDDDKWGFVDAEGEWLVEPVYEDVDDFSEGLGAVKTGGKWGYVEPDGRMRIEPRFDVATEFFNGIAKVCVADRWGFIDREGRWVVEPRFFEIGGFYQGIAPAAVEEEVWGVIDSKGNWIVEPKYYWISDFSTGFARVLELTGEEGEFDFLFGPEHRTGYIDREGNWLAPLSLSDDTPYWDLFECEYPDFESEEDDDFEFEEEE